METKRYIVFSSYVDTREGLTWSLALFRKGRTHSVETYRELISDFDTLDERSALYASEAVDQMLTEQEAEQLCTWLTLVVGLPASEIEQFALPLCSTELPWPYEAIPIDNNSFISNFLDDQDPPFPILAYCHWRAENEPSQAGNQRERTIDEFFRQVISEGR